MARGRRSLVTTKGLSKIEGMNELQANISRMMDKVTGHKLKKLFYRGAATVRDQARRNVDGIKANREVKGWLKKKLIASYGPERYPNAFVVLQGHAPEWRGGGENMPNPYWWEFGTAERTTKSGGARGKMTAQPFFRPAITASRRKVRGILAEGFHDIVQSAGAR